MARFTAIACPLQQNGRSGRDPLTSIETGRLAAVVPFARRWFLQHDISDRRHLCHPKQVSMLLPKCSGSVPRLKSQAFQDIAV